MQLLVILGILVAIGGVVFALQNNVSVTVTFLLWRFDSTLAVVLLLAAGIGAIAVALVSTPSTVKSRWLLGSLRREITSLKADKEALQNRVASLTRGSASESPSPDA